MASLTLVHVMAALGTVASAGAALAAVRAIVRRGRERSNVERQLDAIRLRDGWSEGDMQRGHERIASLRKPRR